ncbi:recombination protein F [Anopheles sinensis]|uniref:Recombination protein F n=1 Tax=Anopheles sinensis TaxID=74873 RepID=A0A084VA07_ANOSI|nr:recombination protein F [Anopheles sinensis]
MHRTGTDRETVNHSALRVSSGLARAGVNRRKPGAKPGPPSVELSEPGRTTEPNRTSCKSATAQHRTETKRLQHRNPSHLHHLKRN